MSQFVKDFYDQHAEREWERLDGPFGRIEFASTLRLIRLYFPKQGHILDIGGVPGRYTIELIQRGYQVSLVDLSDKEIAMARERLDQLGLPAVQTVVGDARDLGWLAPGSCAAALLLGPMYHIIDAEGRANALQQMARILVPGGVTVIAYLNSWGLIRTGISDFPLWYQDRSTLSSMLEEHTFPGRSLSDFTECYWSTPEAAISEVEKAGLEVISYAGAESFAGGMKPLLEQIAADHADAYRNIVQMAAETCELKQYRDSTEHLLIVARRPNPEGPVSGSVGRISPAGRPHPSARRRG